MRQNITINKRWRLFMILFRCDSVYQLMNAIQIKITLLKDEEADLLLSDHTNFDSLIPPLQESGIFEEVKRLYSKKKADEYWTYSKKNVKISAKIHRNMWIWMFWIKNIPNFTLASRQPMQN